MLILILLVLVSGAVGIGLTYFYLWDFERRASEHRFWSDLSLVQFLRGLRRRDRYLYIEPNAEPSPGEPELRSGDLRIEDGEVQVYRNVCNRRIWTPMPDQNAAEEIWNSGSRNCYDYWNSLMNEEKEP